VHAGSVCPLRSARQNFPNMFTKRHARVLKRKCVSEHVEQPTSGGSHGKVVAVQVIVPNLVLINTKSPTITNNNIKLMLNAFFMLSLCNFNVLPATVAIPTMHFL
jgi:hypothetical protein